MAVSLGASVNIKANVSGTSAIDALKNSLKGTSEQTGFLQKGFKEAGNAIKGFVAAYVGYKGIEFIKSIIDTADNLRDLSQVVGVSVQTLSALKTAGESSGVSFEELQVGVKKLAVNLSQAASGSEKQATALNSLFGKDFVAKGKSADEVLFKIADRFKNIKDGPDKARIAVDLFGKSGAALIPVLNEGADEIKKYGLALSDDFANRADQFNDTLIRLGVAVKGDFVKGLESALPVLQEVLNAFEKYPFLVTASAGSTAIVTDSIRLLVSVVDTLAVALTDAVDILVFGAIGALNAFAQSIRGVVNVTQTAIRAIIGGSGENITAAAKKEFNAVTSQFDGLTQRLAARSENYANRQKALFKNFSFFGATDGEAAAKQAAVDTKPKARLTSTATADIAELNKEEQSGIKFAKEKLVTIEAETAALGLNEVARRKVAISAELINKGLKEGTVAYEKYTTAINNALDAQDELKKRPELGAKQAIEDYLHAAEDLATQTKNLFNTSFKSLEDTFVDFFKTGRLSWKKFADDVITELLRIQVRRNIVAPIAGALGSLFSGGVDAAGGTTGFSADYLKMANGGIVSAQGSLPLNKYATGGVANTPQLAMFGEGRLPEAYVPLPDGRSIPVNLQGDASGKGGNVSVTVNLSTSGGGEQVNSNSPSAANLGRAIGAAVRNEIIVQKRPGGLLAS